MRTQSWRIGELANAAGLTVRTLHHYDEIGLLTPSRRTEAGHRLYTTRDVGRLYRILALRQLGLGLSEIGNPLDQPEGDLASVVRRHLLDVERQIAAQADLRSRLVQTLDALERMERPSTEQLLKVMEAMKMMEQYLTREQIEQLRERHRSAGEEVIRRGMEQRAALIAELNAARRNGTDPASPEVQTLMRRLHELVVQFVGDEAILHSLGTMVEREGVETASGGEVSAELAAFLSQASAAVGGAGIAALHQAPPHEHG